MSLTNVKFRKLADRRWTSWTRVNVPSLLKDISVFMNKRRIFGVMLFVLAVGAVMGVLVAHINSRSPGPNGIPKLSKPAGERLRLSLETLSALSERSN